jgi:hypothetical protein
MDPFLIALINPFKACHKFPSLEKWISFSYPVRFKNRILYFNWVIRSLKSIIFIKNSKQRCFSRKIKVNGLQLGLAGSTGSHQVFSFSIFFQRGLVQALDRPGPGSTRWAWPDFKIMLLTYVNKHGIYHCMY